MTAPRAARWTAWCGLGLVLLLVLGISVGASVPDTGDADAAREIAEFWGDDDNQTKAIVGGFLGLYAAFLLVLFAAGIRTLLIETDGDADASGLPAVALAGGGLGAALLAASISLHVVVGATLSRSDGFRLDPNQAILVENISYWLWSGALLGIGALALATSLAARRTGLLPPAVVWFGFVLTLVALTGPLLAFLGYLLLPLWVAAVSVSLLTRRALAAPSGP